MRGKARAYWVEPNVLVWFGLGAGFVEIGWSRKDHELFSLTQLFGNQNFASPVLRSEPNIDWLTNVLAFQIGDLSWVKQRCGGSDFQEARSFWREFYCNDANNAQSKSLLGECSTMTSFGCASTVSAIAISANEISCPVTLQQSYRSMRWS